MITTYATLQTEVAGWLNRSDLTDAVKTFIQLAEARLKKDPRCRRLENQGTLTANAETAALPADFLSLEALYHDGGTYYGPLEIVPREVLGDVRGRYSDTGVPRYASVVESNLYFAPVPDGTYTLKFTYWQTLTALSDANTTNWLLDAHPDIYLYAALSESAPYLHDDPRVAIWASQLEERLNNLHLSTWHRHASGTMRRQFDAIG